MRHVIYLLLVANLVFFGWNMLQLQKQDGMVRPLPEIPATASTFFTLKEMEQWQEPEWQPEPEPGLQEPISVPETEPDPGLQELISGSETALDPGLQEPASGFEPELDSGLLESVSGPEPEPGLREPIEQQDMVETLTRLQPPGGGGAITCRTLGPIVAVAQLKSLSGKLDAMGLEPRHRTSEKREAHGYWVYLPAMKYSDAQEIKRTLDQHKDTEYYIGRDNYISLGTFREKSRAEVRLRQASKLGLEALLEPRYEKQIVHWLDIDRQTGSAVDLGPVMDEYPEVGLQERACY